MGDGGEVRLGREGTAVGWVHAALFAALLTVLVVMAAGAGVYTLLPGLASLGIVLVVMVSKLLRLGDDELVLDDDGVVARTGGAERRWPWSEVLEIVMSRVDVTGPYLSPGCTVFIRSEGRAFDVPGPNAPFPVRVPVFGFRAQSRVRSELRRVCAQRGVPFDTRSLRTVVQPRPDSPLRTLTPGRASRAEEPQ